MKENPITIHTGKHVHLASYLVGSEKPSLPTVVSYASSLWNNKLKLFVIFAIGSLILAGMGLDSYALSNHNDSSSSSIIKYHVKVGTEKYFIKFNVCSEKTIEKPSLIVKTDKETKEISYKKIIFSGTCKSFETIVNAKHPSKILVEFDGESLA